MGSERDQTSYRYNPFFNTLIFWQNYVSKWSEANLRYYDNLIEISEYWYKTFWEPWLKGVRTTQKETTKVE